MKLNRPCAIQEAGHWDGLLLTLLIGNELLTNECMNYLPSSVKIPFETEKHAHLAVTVIGVDKILRSDTVSRELHAEGTDFVAWAPHPLLPQVIQLNSGMV